MENLKPLSFQYVCKSTTCLSKTLGQIFTVIVNCWPHTVWANCKHACSPTGVLQKPDSSCKVNTRQQTVSMIQCVKVHCRRFRTQRTWLIKAWRVSGDSKPTHRCVYRLLAGEVSHCQTEMSLRIHSAISYSSRLRWDGGLRWPPHLCGYRMSHCCLGLMVKLWDFLNKTKVLFKVKVLEFNLILLFLLWKG